MPSGRKLASKRECRDCVYSGWLRDGRSGGPPVEVAEVLVCAQRPETPGELVQVDPGATCPGFRARRGPPGMVVDHINGHSVNNRRCNLRVCTPQQNHFNSRPRKKRSKFKGVRFEKDSGRWYAEITHDGVKYHLGTFDDERDAARAYDRRAVELQGPFARLNFPEDEPPK